MPAVRLYSYVVGRAGVLLVVLLLFNAATAALCAVCLCFQLSKNQKPKTPQNQKQGVVCVAALTLNGKLQHPNPNFERKPFLAVSEN